MEIEGFISHDNEVGRTGAEVPVKTLINKWEDKSKKAGDLLKEKKEILPKIFKGKAISSKSPEVAKIEIFVSKKLKIIKNKEPDLQQLENKQLKDNIKKTDGSEIKFEYKFKNKIYGGEKVLRNNTIEEAISISQRKIDYLTSKIEKLRIDLENLQKSKPIDRTQKDVTNQITDLQKTIKKKETLLKFCTQNLANAKTKLTNPNDPRPTWISSNEFRKLLRENPGTYHDKVEKIVHSPLNLRRHIFESPDGSTKGFLRGGVITDERNGRTNLREMKEMQKNPQKLNAKRAEIRDEIAGLKTKSRGKINSKIESAEYALAQIDPKALEKSIEERRMILQDRFLQLINSHIIDENGKLNSVNSQFITSMKDHDVFNFVHLSLLNHTTSSLDKKGWMHDEKNALEDMAEIFREFAGKKVYFDGKGPLIDDKGNIHLALKAQVGAPKVLTLQPIFSNISPQKHQINDGVQRVVNHQALHELEEIVRKTGKDSVEFTLFKKIKTGLENGDSNYYLAEDLSTLIMQLGIPLSIGCLSGKDRTGYVCARTCLRMLEKEIDQDQTLSVKENKQLKEKFANQILDAASPGAQVVKDNTGATVLKCSPKDLPGFNKLRRYVYFVNQGLLYAKGIIEAV